MKYVEFINQEIRRQAAEHDNLVLFGQNINAGSYVSGFTKGLSVKPGNRVINSTNTENSLVGFGFGLMLSGASAVFFVKQLDFLMLGIDQIVDTYNIIRNISPKPKGSFTIMPIIVDSGYQGPQSSLNNFSDFCSIAHVPGFAITNQIDAEAIISTYMVSTGFRIIGVSQRLFGTEIIVPEKCTYKNNDLTLFQYKDGKDASVVTFNFSLPYGLELAKALEENKIQASLFNINSMTPIAWDKIIENVKITKKIVIIDDSKSINLSCHHLAYSLGRIPEKTIIITRQMNDNDLGPQPENLPIDYQSIIAELKL